MYDTILREKNHPFFTFGQNVFSRVSSANIIPRRSRFRFGQSGQSDSWSVIYRQTSAHKRRYSFSLFQASSFFRVRNAECIGAGEGVRSKNVDLFFETIHQKDYRRVFASAAVLHIFRYTQTVVPALSKPQALCLASPSGKMILFTKKNTTIETPPLRTVVPMLYSHGATH